MKKLLIFLLSAGPFLAYGQKVDRYIIVAGGEYYEAPSTSIVWTLGEVAVEHYTSGDMLLTEGIHQGNLIATPVPGIPAGIELKAYPNPVADILIIETEKQDLSYRLIDVHGRVMEIGTIRSSSFELDLSSLPSGMYFLWVESYQTHKIIKK
jgi:hypothetical protein